MNKVHYRNYGILFFFFSLLFSMFAVNAISKGLDAEHLFFASIFIVTAIMQFRLALLMCRKYNELKLK